MAIFAVIQTRESPKLADNVDKMTNLGVANGVWLVSFAGTADDLSEQLEVASGIAGSAIILKVTTYSGRTVPSTWDWLRTHWD